MTRATGCAVPQPGTGDSEHRPSTFVGNDLRAAAVRFSRSFQRAEAVVISVLRGEALGRCVFLQADEALKAALRIRLAVRMLEAMPYRKGAVMLAQELSELANRLEGRR